MRQQIKNLLPASIVRAIQWALDESRALTSQGKRNQQAKKLMEGYFDENSIRAAIGDVSSDWRIRIDDVKACPDNAFIVRCEKAGEVSGSYILMHNGIRVLALGYYGTGILNLLIENRGVHEPQEEYAFQQLLGSDCLPEEPVMLELGAYWGFYSLWLKQNRPKARCIMIEPMLANLESGRANFAANGKEGEFIHAFAGKASIRTIRATPTISVDSIFSSKQLKNLEFHSRSTNQVLGNDYNFVSLH